MKGRSTQVLRQSSMFLSGAFAGLMLTGAAFAYQGNLHSALDSLYAAKNSLLRATPNKEGHRVEAIRLVNDAIAETKRGIAAGQN